MSYPVSHSQLERYAYNVIRNLQTFTADDLHVLEGEIAECKRDKRVIGALLKSFQAQGIIVPDGYVKSSRVKCHGRPIVRWRVL
jgi:hypothetical protein